MAILRSPSNRFFEIPDATLENFAIPPEKLKEVLAAMGPEGPEAQVQPYHRRRRRHYWHNYWSNCWRNCWRNCY